MTALEQRSGAGAATGSTSASRERGLAWLYAIGGLVGLAAAFALTLEKIATLSNPDYVPTCSLNPVVACGSVMDSPQAAAFGFANPLIGLVTFPVIVTMGVAMLSGYVPPRWVRAGMQIGVTLGVVFVHWLIYASLYDIGALCPYCMVVWAATVPIFWYTTLSNVHRVRLPASLTRVTGVLTRFHSAVLAAWFLLIAVLILHAFWSYWTGQA